MRSRMNAKAIHTFQARARTSGLSPLARAVAVAAVTGGLTGAAWAANKAWDTGGNADNTFGGANWSINTIPAAGGTAVAATGDALYFGQAATTTLTNNLTGATFAGLTFNTSANGNASAFMLGGNGFTLGGNITNGSTSSQIISNDLVLNAARTVSTNTSTSLTFNGNISGAFALTVNPTNNASASYIYLNGNNTYTGGTTIGFATLRIGSATALGTGTLGTNNNGHFDNAAADDTLTLANGIVGGAGGMYFDGTNSLTFTGTNTFGNQLTVNSGTNSKVLTLTGSTTMTASNNFTVNNAGTLALNGAVNFGTFTLQKSGNGKLVLGSADTGTGVSTSIGGVNYVNNLRVNAGTLELGNAAALSTGVLDLRAATLQGNTALTGASKITNTIVNATGTPTIGGANNIELGGEYILSNGVTNNASTLNITNTGATKISGNISLTDATAAVDSQTFTVNVDAAAGATEFSGVIQNKTTAGIAGSVGSFIKTGGGSLLLSGNNTYTGTTDIQNGTLGLSGSIASTSLNLGNGVNSAKVVLGGSSGVNLTLNSLTTAGTGTANAIVGGSSAVSTLTVNSATNSVFNGGLGGTGTNENNLALVKNGAGTLALTGNSTFNGATTINGGTLITGALANSNVTITSGGLNSSGSVKSIVVASGAANAVANGNGTATGLSTNSLTFNGSGALNLTTSAATMSSSPLTVSGALSTSGTNSLSFSVATSDSMWTPGTYNLISYGSLAGTGYGAFPASAGVNVIGLTPRQTEVVANNGSGLVTLTIAGTNPVYTGSVNGNWDYSTQNFKLAGTSTATAFIANDLVTFDGTSSNNTVSINNGNVTPVRVDFNAGTYVINGPYGITGSGSVRVASGVDLTLASPNGYTGGTTVADANLKLNNATALGSGRLTLNGVNGTVSTLDNTSGADVAFTNNIAQTWNTDVVYAGTNSLDMGTGTVDINASRTVTVNNNTLSVGGLNGVGFNLAKEGVGKFRVNGNSTFTGTTNVNNGELELDGNAGSSSTDIRVALVAGKNATLTVGGASTVINARQIFVAGSGAGDANFNGIAAPQGTVNQNAGIINAASYVVVGYGAIYDGLTFPTATYNLSGGELRVAANRMEVASGLGAIGTLNVSGTGALKFYNNTPIVLGTANGANTGTVNQTGGSVTFYSDAGTTVGGTGSITLGLATTLGITGLTSTPTYTYNLNGGTLTVPEIKRTATSNAAGVLNLNGGTLQAAKATTNWVHDLTHIYAGSNGALINDGGFAVTLAQPIEDGGGGGLTKSGAGQLLLSAANTYVGPTTVTAGQLRISGSINNSSSININGTGAKLVNVGTSITPAVTVTNGMLDGTGTYGNVTVANNASNVITHGDGTNAHLALGNLTFNGAGNLTVDITGGTPAITVGNLSALGSAGSVKVNATNSGWTNGQTYNLVGYSGSFSGLSAFGLGTFTNLGARQTVAFTNPSGFLAAFINGDTPVWTGAVNNNWTTATLASPKNWKLQTAGTITDFLTTDQVIFDDTATGSTNVSIGDANVSPSSVVFKNASKVYTLSGPYGIAAGTVTKNNAGTVVVTNANTYTGLTTINGGAYNIQSAGGLSPASAVTVNSGGAVELQGGIVTTAGSGSLTLNGTGTTASPAGALRNVSGLNTLSNPIKLASNATIQSDADTLTLGNTGTAALVMTGSANLTFAGAGNGIANGVISGSGSLTKTGGGNWTLNATNTFTGGTTVNGGTLTLAKGGGVSSLRGPLTINTGGTVIATAGDALGYNAGSQVTTVTVNTGATFDSTTVGGNQSFNTNWVVNGGTVSATGGARYNFDNGYGITTTASGVTGTFSGGVSLRGTGITYDIAAGSTLNATGSISGGSTGVIKNGNGTLLLGGTNTHGGGVIVNAGTLLIGNGDAAGVSTASTTGTTGSLTLASGTVAQAQNNLAKAVTLTGLSIAGDAVPTAKFDLYNDSLVIRNGTFATTYAQVKNAYVDGGLNDWKGNGIGTTLATAKTAIGIASNDQLHLTSFGGVTDLNGASTEILARYTLYGDADLDGGVSINDFNLLAANFGQTGKVWSQGDFDYDGGVSINDFNLLAANFGKTLTSSSDGPNFAALSMWGFAVAHNDQAGFIAATGVPEPAALSLLGLAAFGLGARRRKAVAR